MTQADQTSSYLSECISELNLPLQFTSVVQRWYQPIADDIAAMKNSLQGTLVIGIQGTQGSGKSTMANFLALLLEKQYKFNVANLSLDDFYLTRQQRIQLSENVHPLFKTRGVPGTHDLDLAITTIEKLKAATEQHTVEIPRFNKAVDDRFEENKWSEIIGPVDIVIFEGWCVGADAMPSDSLQNALNSLEEEHDPDCCWREYVNQQLDETYPALFSLLDHLLVISTDSFDNVYHWRLLQEQKLAQKWSEENPGQESKIIDDEALKHFIAHYERITRHCLSTLPEKATWQLTIDKDHNFLELNRNKALTE